MIIIDACRMIGERECDAGGRIVDIFVQSTK